MKKVGILTFHASHNNGSMLQALALQTILTKKYNYDTEIINYSNEAQQNMYSVLPRVTNIKKLIKDIIFLSNISQLKKQYISYNKFMDKYFKLSGPIFSDKATFNNVKDKYDAIITGSDQVWNIKAQDADDLYYLNFKTAAHKLSYAVSFGANNPFVSPNAQKYVKYIKDLELISVREHNAQKWIKEGTGIAPQICLDPTMLLTKEEWEKTVDVGDQIIKGDYIFYYCFSINNEVQKFLKYLSKKYNMPVYFMEAKEWTLKTCWKNKIKLIKEYGPDVYMNVVKYSKLFVTTSFHGTAFATIYSKNFWYIDSGHNDPSKDDRAISFLTQLNLMDRYKTIEKLKGIDLLNAIPDYKSVYKNLKALREDSFKYLDNLSKVIDNGK